MDLSVRICVPDLENMKTWEALKVLPWAALASRQRPTRESFAGAVMVAVATITAGGVARADESGVSFWLPGQMGSFAAVPGEPGWSLPLVYYHTSADAGAGRSFEIGGQVRAGLKAIYPIIHEFVETHCTERPPLLSRIAQIQIDGLEDLSTNHDQYVTGAKRA